MNLEITRPVFNATSPVESFNPNGGQKAHVLKPTHMLVRELFANKKPLAEIPQDEIVLDIDDQGSLVLEDFNKFIHARHLSVSANKEVWVKFTRGDTSREARVVALFPNKGELLVSWENDKGDPIVSTLRSATPVHAFIRLTSNKK